MDPKSYEAFRVQSIIETLPGNQRVESLCPWNGYLLVGLQDGTIVQFSGQQDEGAWQVVRGHRSLERKAVVQMAAVQLAKRPLLLTLTEDGVNLLTLPDMKLKFQPMGSRGASMFAWSEESQLLAVAVRRKVILYHLHGSDLLDSGERTAPDLVSTMVWVSGGVLLLGMRRQYVMLNTTTGTVTEVGITGSAPHPLGVLCPGGREMLLVRDNSAFYHNTTDGRFSRRRHLQWSEPLLALAAAGQHAVAVTASGLEVRSLRRIAEGHVVQRVLLLESQRPVPPAVSEDGSVFVVAPGTATTSAPAGAHATAATTASSGTATNTILRLVPVPLEEQAHTLAKMGEYGEALALAALLDDEGEGEASAVGRESGGGAPSVVGSEPGFGDGCRTSSSTSSGRRELLEERLRLAYGHYLFQEGEYDEGMAQLALCKSTTALVLLRLFPSLVPPKFKHYLPTHAAGQRLPEVSEPTGEAYVTAVSQLLPYVLSHRTRAMNALADEKAAAVAFVHSGATRREEGLAKAQTKGSERHEEGKEESAAGPGDAVNGTAMMNISAGAKALQGQVGAPSDSLSVSPGGGIGAKNGCHSVQLTAADAAVTTATAGSVNNTEPAGNGVGGARESRNPPDVGTLSFPPPPPPQETLVILDTAIVRIMVAMPDSGSLLRFVQMHNYVDLQEGEQALEESGMYAELAALYKFNGCHEKGLELLRKLSQDPGSLSRPARGAAADLPGLPGVWAAVRYMVSLSAADADAIQRHAGWILAADAEAGLSALLHMRPPLHPSLALSILNQHSAHYCGLYLETALQIGVALPQDYHNELLLIYLRDILSKEPTSSSRASNHSGEELKELLLSHRPDPDQTPVLFPEDLAHALLKPTPSSAAMAVRRFASAPASSAGTPALMSRVGSRSSMQSGGGAAAAQAAEPDRGAALQPRSGRDSVASTEENGGSSTSEDADEAEVNESTQDAEAQRPLKPVKLNGHGMAAWRPRKSRGRSVAAELPAKASEMDRSRRPRRPRRSSADTLGSFAGSKPPLPASQGAAAATATSPSGGINVDASAAASAAAAAAAGPSLYQRLRDLVYTSPYIDPGYVLDKLPLGELLEIRALMLERLGNHREALRLYVHALRDLAAAEAYCDRVYAAAVTATDSGNPVAAALLLPSGGRAGPRRPGRTLAPLDAGVLGDLTHPEEIYLELVRALYDGPESCPSAKAMVTPGSGLPVVGTCTGTGGLASAEMGTNWLLPSPYMSREEESRREPQLDSSTWQALSRLLSRKRDRLDPMPVLNMLPDGVAVADVLPWLEGALRYTIEARRNLAVVRQLHRSENLTALEDAVRMRQQRISVTSERACSLCHKRLGSAAFVSYPGGLLAHYSCHMRHTGGYGSAVMAPASGGGAGAAAAALLSVGGLGGSGGGQVGAHVVELQHGGVRGLRGHRTGGAEVVAWA
ncbi:hypothetical protein VaNZ11_005842 [Volvox africanus]|uniref:CNH domain-containing protein n=1 Tax=Volvox africanus TaxID=51714 RepID=A0ABQ5RZC4_9CHLO|nr:hypothetical protein VaNZ11_005842 [Volvox africanus]